MEDHGMAGSVKQLSSLEHLTPRQIVKELDK